MEIAKDSITDEQSRILVVQTAFLGDIILTTPLLCALKQLFPKSHLALLTTPTGKQALEDLKEIDEIISYDKHHSERGIKNLLKKAKELRQKEFDFALSPHRSYRTALLLFLSKIPVLVGFEDASFSWIYHFRVQRDKSLHEVERNLSLLEPVAELPKNFEPKITLPNFNSLSLERFGIGEKKRLIGIFPGSAWQTKRWLADYYARLIDMIYQEGLGEVILLGSKADEPTCREIINQTSSSPLNLAGKTSIKDLFAIVSQLSLVISNDSAGVHIASGYSVPVVVIYGPTVPEFGFAPYKVPNRILQKELDCRPCHHHGPRSCPEGHFRCMKEILPEEVFKAVKDLLEEQKNR